MHRIYKSPESNLGGGGVEGVVGGRQRVVHILFFTQDNLSLDGTQKCTDVKKKNVLNVQQLQP